MSIREENWAKSQRDLANMEAKINKTKPSEPAKNIVKISGY